MWKIYVITQQHSSAKRLSEGYGSDSMPINQYQHIQHKYTRINLNYFDRIFSLQAINSPGEETEKSAWEAFFPAVEQLKDFYEFSL